MNPKTAVRVYINLHISFFCIMHFLYHDGQNLDGIKECKLCSVASILAGPCALSFSKQPFVTRRPIHDPFTDIAR